MVKSLSDEKCRDCQSGIQERTKISLDNGTEKHDLKIGFKWPLIRDGIAYEVSTNMNVDYKVIKKG